MQTLLKKYGDQVQITAIAIKFDGQSVKQDAPQQMNFGAEKIQEPPEDKSKLVDLFGAEFEQAELPLQNISRGIFLNTSPINYQGEDLDVPTFQRKGIVIDKG